MSDENNSVNFLKGETENSGGGGVVTYWFRTLVKIKWHYSLQFNIHLLFIVIEANRLIATCAIKWIEDHSINIYTRTRTCW